MSKTENHEAQIHLQQQMDMESSSVEVAGQSEVKTIYLLVDQDIEGCFPLLAFFDKTKAEDFKRESEAYENLKPRGSFSDYCEENNPELDEWNTKYEAWQLGHPVHPGFSGADDYQLLEIEIRDVAEFVNNVIKKGERHD